MLFTKFAWDFKSGSGQGWCKSIRAWYNSKDPMWLAKEFTRVKARCGRSHSVLLQKSHIKVAPGDVVRDAVIKYAIFGLKRAKQLMENIEGTSDVFDYIQRVEDLKHCEDPTAASAMIIQNKFSLDHVPTHFLTSQEVWDAILPQMSLNDILHNLHRLHNMGFLTSDSTTTTILISLLENKDMIKRSNLNPLNVYITICSYKKKSVPMKFEKLKVAVEKTARRRTKQKLDSKTGLWEWTITKCHTKEVKYWGFEKCVQRIVNVKSGTKSGDYRDDMNYVNYELWSNTPLLPNLSSNSVIVLDNATYYNKWSESALTSNSRKAEMQVWLKDKGIDVAPDLLRPQLHIN
ncbi:hypothetical protein EVAR_22862_1 [Eumeta japonica]|uniref:TROVE domain-containing protein n=1 Tax=Eumeta variegata TaxID=151549 RepID=A0A4C1UVY9_EUMVA|nr:hypothetical protein EVAR_22862_1 [Eumeta japonica]